MMTAAEIAPLRAAGRPPSEPRHFVARVELTRSDGLQLQSGGRTLQARRATGCLLRPEDGDRVLALELGDEAWVLSVLERERDPSRAAVIETAGPLALRAGRGDVDIDAPGSVRVRAAETIGLETPELEIRAGIASMITRKLSWLCDRMEGRFVHLRVVGRVVDSVLERLSLKAGSSFRQVDSLDHARCGQIDYNAGGDLSLKAGNLLGHAKGLARINGKQIHLG